MADADSSCFQLIERKRPLPTIFAVPFPSTNGDNLTMTLGVEYWRWM